jgi:hypothetical protein
MREIRQSGSVRGVRRNPYPYRDFHVLCGRMVHFKHRDILSLIQTTAAAIEPCSQQHQLACSISNGITHQVINRASPHYGGTPRVRPPQIEDRIDQFANYRKTGQANKDSVRTRQQSKGVWIVEEAPRWLFLCLQCTTEGYVLGRLASLSVLHQGSLFVEQCSNNMSIRIIRIWQIHRRALQCCANGLRPLF